MVLVQKWPFFQGFFLGNLSQENVFYDILERKSLLQAIKKRSSKSRKIDIFPTGLTHGFGTKMAIFATFFLQAIQERKMSFTIFQNEKTPFQAIKTRNSNGRKIDIFPKGLTHGFGAKMAIFPTFFFQAIQARKMSLMIFYNEKTLFQPIKKLVQKVEKLTFFLRGLPMVQVQKWPFFELFFFSGNLGKENVFYDILERKNAFLTYKNRKFKTSKN